ncbi:MAG: hypothetical protein ACLQDM_23470 [Bradyrhizobium sp.]
MPTPPFHGAMKRWPPSRPAAGIRAELRMQSIGTGDGHGAIGGDALLDFPFTQATLKRRSAMPPFVALRRYGMAIDYIFVIAE